MQRSQAGFTLVELAIVLVVIGLILGMAFKGKDLIDSAKVKGLAAQYNKIVAGVNIFYEKYGFYPGDGCSNTGNATTPSACTGTRNGLIENGNEAASFWTLLQGTNILTANERRSVFGQDWTVWANGNQVWLDFTGSSNAESRMACALDKMIDDGNSATGIVLNGDYNAGGSPTGVTGQTWTSATDCWGLTGQANLGIRIMP